MLAQAAALLPSERAATTRSLDESAGDNWLRCFRSTPVFHITTRQRDLLMSFSRMVSELLRHSNRPEVCNLIPEHLRLCHRPQAVTRDDAPVV